MSTVDLSRLRWRKSSRSSGAGDNGACVEIAFAETWRKSSRSTANGDYGNCVEVAFAGPVVAVRDSKNPTAGTLTFPAAAFTRLIPQTFDLVG